MIFREKLGIEPFDTNVGGIPSGVFSVVETPDHRSGLTVLGHYLHEGLKAGEICTLISLENANSFMDYFQKSAFDFYPYLKSGQFCFLNFESTVSMEIGLTQNYEQVFSEILHLSHPNCRRIAINQIDTLFSMHNQTLISTCAQKLSMAIDKVPQTVLGQFVQFNDMSHQHLSIASSKVASCHFSLASDSYGKEPHYSLLTHKVPWYEYDPSPIRLTLNGGKGLVTRLSEVG